MIFFFGCIVIQLIFSSCTALWQLMYYQWTSEIAESCLTLWDPMDCTHQAPPSMAFSRKEYWSGLPFPSPHSTSFVMYIIIFPGGSGGKESACNAGDPSLTPGSGRSPGEGNGYPLQYSCLGNPTDRGAWRLQSMGLQRVDRLSDSTLALHFHGFILLSLADWFGWFSPIYQISNNNNTHLIRFLKELKDLTYV